MSGASPRRDRHGRLVGQVVALGDPSRWLQQEAVMNGQAVVDAAGPCAGELLAAEAEARRARRGLWRTLPVRAAADGDLTAAVSEYVIVGGRVVSAGLSGERVYLNFGHDWATDFTITLSLTLAREIAGPDGNLPLDRAGLNAIWAGRRIEARGWLESRGGPYMDVKSPRALVLAER
ncbi:thermonuclease family protein [Methylobrevis pamukkalensis]|uniref:TNase-like domain-containing protein n=1 Tax=Methylobrevis pamukkalensis TaxID=1439726 RepID=A0A1E3H2V9_9HYPH|nr:thermonuclease family protein [Methylobrevis pamukkalensis]ODN69881.1 hypothetical protein A6302_02816 [Methylobrevis pamukkalensis]